VSKSVDDIRTEVAIQVLVDLVVSGGGFWGEGGGDPGSGGEEAA
jgi:phage gp46-like protein